MSIPAFWVVQTEVVQISLRRLTLDPARPCPSGYHEAVRELWRAPALHDEHGFLQARDPDDFMDLAWPDRCDWQCGYRFTEEDSFQVVQERVYRRPDTGTDWIQRRLPPGAMFDGFWHPRKGPDGLALVVVLPPGTADTAGHHWFVDACSRDDHGNAGAGWTRTGDPTASPPTVSVSPSIRSGGWHGWLQLEDGASVLVEALG